MKDELYKKADRRLTFIYTYIQSNDFEFSWKDFNHRLLFIKKLTNKVHAN